jgi:N4-gp56 family major capsid protein
MPTTIPAGHPLAIKWYSRALFAEAQRKPSFRNNMIGPAPKQASAEEKLRNQTSPDFPFIRINDLRKSAGDTVSVDLVNVVNIRPTMGDKKLAGRMGSLTFDSMDMKIQQARFGVDTGGRMTQQRTLHQLRGLAKANLTGINVRFEDQITQVHLSGARGYQNTKDWVVPLASDPEFAEIVVNTVSAPTYSRRIIAGGGDSINDIGTSDYLSLADFDRMRAIIDTMAFPPQPIMLPGDAAANDEPLYCYYATPLQWHYLQTTTGSGEWRTFIQNAWNRAKSFTGPNAHPLFSGSPGMWNGILIKKLGRAVRFEDGDLCDEYATASATTTTAVAAPEPVERGVLLGAQALAWAYGKHGGSGAQYSWNEELEDHKNVLEVSTAAMSGCSKVTFTGSDGVSYDHGVFAVDSYAPAVT